MAEQGGRDTDGEGTQGMVEEKTRPARAGETGTTRFGMEGDDTDGTGSRGMVDKAGSAAPEGIIGTEGGPSGNDSTGDAAGDNMDEDSQ